MEWLIGRLVRGVLNLLTGEEGVGKGTLLAWLIGRATRGELPGALYDRPARVLWIGDEDSWERVVGPRLYVAGADLSMVRDLTMGNESALLDIVRDARRWTRCWSASPTSWWRWRRWWTTCRVRNPTDMVEIRAALRPLRRVLAKHETTGLGTLHTTKTDTDEFRRKQAARTSRRAVAQLAVRQLPPTARASATSRAGRALGRRRCR